MNLFFVYLKQRIAYGEKLASHIQRSNFVLEQIQIEIGTFIMDVIMI